MGRLTFPILVAVGLLVGSSVRAEVPPERAVADRLLVLPAADVDVEELLARLSAELEVPLALERSSILGWHLVSTAGADLSEPAALVALAGQLQADDEVDAAHPDWLKSPAYHPNDPLLPDQWAIEQQDMETAWDWCFYGSGQLIAVVDTGTIAHEELAGPLVGGYDFVSDPWTAADGDGREPDFTDPGNGADCGEGWQDSDWHGTAVASVAAAATGNSLGIAGMAFRADLLSVRVLGRCGGAISDIYEGAFWAAGGDVPGVPEAKRIATVITLALSGPPACADFEQDALQELDTLGAVVVSAVGNDGADAALVSPASCGRTIRVAAHGRTETASSYSNLGSDVDLFAPGGDQAGTGLQEHAIRVATGPGMDEYGWLDGTSMAAAHVAGAAALVLDNVGSWNWVQVKEQLRERGSTVYCPDGAPCPAPGLDMDDVCYDVGKYPEGDDDTVSWDDDDQAEDDLEDDDRPEEASSQASELVPGCRCGGRRRLPGGGGGPAAGGAPARLSTGRRHLAQPPSGIIQPCAGSPSSCCSSPATRRRRPPS